MPVQVSYRCLFVSSSMLEVLIIEFADWHNGLINLFNPAANKRLASSASSLMEVINEINTASYA
jgi:hypothetical protein